MRSLVNAPAPTRQALKRIECISEFVCNMGGTRVEIVWLLGKGRGLSEGVFTSTCCPPQCTGHTQLFARIVYSGVGGLSRGLLAAMASVPQHCPRAGPQ